MSQQQRPGHEVCFGTQPLTGWTVTLFKPPSGQELGNWGEGVVPCHVQARTEYAEQRKEKEEEEER